tara:strand:+ start:13935 stop:14672 length:738 start_codon:yes stop_codon:yes gene_type:complete
MLKRTTIFIIALIIVVGLSGQSSPERIHSIFYLKANNGDKNQLEKGIAEHIKKFHSDGEWPEYVHEVIAGERTGQYFYFSAAHQWVDFDNRVRSQSDVQHWEANIVPYVDENSSSLQISFVRYIPALSLPYDPNNYKMFRVVYNYVEPGKELDFEFFVKKNVEAHKKLKDGHKHHFFKPVLGGKLPVYVGIHPMKNFEDMNEPRGVFRKVYDEEEVKGLYKKFHNSVEKRISELWKSRPDLSSPN